VLDLKVEHERIDRSVRLRRFPRAGDDRLPDRVVLDWDGKEECVRILFG
jgi:hypothetical protein